MFRLRIVRIVAWIFLAAVLSSVTFADGIPNLSVAPVSSTVSLGTTFAVDVNISGVTELYDFGLDLGFNPAVLQATNITEGAFLPIGGPTFFLSGFIDNGAGTITFNADTLESLTAGVTGSGTLIKFDFKAIGSGFSLLTLDPTTLILQDSTGVSINNTTRSGSVTVQGTTAVPEPSVLMLLSGGLMALASLTLRKKIAAGRATNPLFLTSSLSS
jgi:Cohesin domain/PEP-CTERM motif